MSEQAFLDSIKNSEMLRQQDKKNAVTQADHDAADKAHALRVFNAAKANPGFGLGSYHGLVEHDPTKSTGCPSGLY